MYWQIKFLGSLGKESSFVLFLCLFFRRQRVRYVCDINFVMVSVVFDLNFFVSFFIWRIDNFTSSLTFKYDIYKDWSIWQKYESRFMYKHI